MAIKVRMQLLHGGVPSEERSASGDRFLIGRDPEAEFPIDDSALSWHQAVLAHRSGGLWLENLGASGCVVRGRAVRVPCRLRPGEEVVLGDSVRVRFEAWNASGRRLSGSPAQRISVIAGAVALLFVAVIATSLLQAPPQASRPIDPVQAHLASLERIEQWERALVVDRELPKAFREAWRIEWSGDRAAAEDAWRSIARILRSTPLPGAPSRTIGALYGSAKERAPIAALISDPRGCPDEVAADAIMRVVLWGCVEPHSRLIRTASFRRQR